MPIHTVKLQILEKVALGKNTGKNSGIKIEIFSEDGEENPGKLGTIQIGSGTFRW